MQLALTNHLEMSSLTFFEDYLGIILHKEIMLWSKFGVEQDDPASLFSLLVYFGRRSTLGAGNNGKKT